MMLHSNTLWQLRCIVGHLRASDVEVQKEKTTVSVS